MSITYGISEADREVGQDGPKFCRLCGLDAREANLSGCKDENMTAHEFVGWESQPYEDWTVDQILARLARARSSEIGAAAILDHLETCDKGVTSYLMDLYREKRNKRRNIGDALVYELERRARDLEARERPFRLR